MTDEQAAAPHADSVSSRPSPWLQSAAPRAWIVQPPRIERERSGSRRERRSCAGGARRIRRAAGRLRRLPHRRGRPDDGRRTRAGDAVRHGLVDQHHARSEDRDRRLVVRRVRSRDAQGRRGRRPQSLSGDALSVLRQDRRRRHEGAVGLSARKGLAPVEQANRRPRCASRSTCASGLSFWNVAFLDATPFKPDPAKDAVWNRGAYLVQGLGHCGACHTPRGIAFQEKAMSDAGPAAVTISPAPRSRTGMRSSCATCGPSRTRSLMLKTGQNRFATVSGGMTEVILHSTQHLTDQDLTAIATYLKALPSDRPDLPSRRIACDRGACPTCSPPAAASATRSSAPTVIGRTAPASRASSRRSPAIPPSPRKTRRRWCISR